MFAAVLNEQQLTHILWACLRIYYQNLWPPIVIRYSCYSYYCCCTNYPRIWWLYTNAFMCSLTLEVRNSEGVWEGLKTWEERWLNSEGPELPESLFTHRPGTWTLMTRVRVSLPTGVLTCPCQCLVASPQECGMIGLASLLTQQPGIQERMFQKAR